MLGAASFRANGWAYMAAGIEPFGVMQLVSSGRGDRSAPRAHQSARGTVRRPASRSPRRAGARHADGRREQRRPPGRDPRAAAAAGPGRGCGWTCTAARPRWGRTTNRCWPGRAKALRILLTWARREWSGPETLGVGCTSSVRRSRRRGEPVPYTRANPADNPLSGFVPITRVGCLPLALMTSRMLPFMTFTQFKHHVRSHADAAT